MLPELLLYTVIVFSVVVVAAVVVVVVVDVGHSLTKQASVSDLLELASLQVSKFLALSTQYDVLVRRPQLHVELQGDHSDQANSIVIKYYNTLQ